MKKIHLLTLLISDLALFSCTTNEPKSDIHLNKGEKWKVNSEMKPHIDRGDEILDAFVAEEYNDYSSLAKDLKAQNSALIKSCTMTGEGHNELHKWLHPHMELINKLSQSKDQKEVADIISQLEDSFKLYHTYFE